MAVELATGYINVVPSARGFSSKLSSELGPAAATAGTDAGTKAGKSFVGGMGTAIKAVGAFLIAQQVGRFFKGAFDQAQESIKTSAQTTAVLKSTGGQANVTKKQIEALSNALSKKVGIDDEVIQAGENMLLTFRSVRNEAGKGNDVFNQATKATLDLAVGTKSLHGGQVDLKAASILLGKALNDPVKGMTALRRVGVQLSAADQQTIKDLVAQGKLREAQKVILAEVTKEFGGSAEAQATAADKAGVAWGNLQEAIGKALIPVISKLADVLTPLLTFLSENQPVLIALAAIIGGALVAAFVAWAISAGAAAVATLTAAAPLLAIAAVIAVVIAAAVLLWTNWDQVWTWIKDHPAYAVIIAILAAPVAAFVLIIGALKFLWENWDTIWGWIKQAAEDAWNAISSAAGTAWGVISPVLDGIRVAIGAVVDALGFLKGIWDAVFGGLVTVVSGVGAGVAAALSPIIDTFNTIIRLAGMVADALDSITHPFGSGPSAQDFVDLSNAKRKAAGGPVMAGMPYIVGEHRAELFVPDVNGTILPQVPAMAGRPALFDGATVHIGDRNVIPDLNWFDLVHNAGN